MGMRNEGIVATQTAQSFCRKTPTLHFLHHVQWRILGCRPPYPCARGAGSCNLKDVSYDSPWRALRTICPIFLARGHLFCRSAGSQAVTVFTDTKLVPSADAAFKVLDSIPSPSCASRVIFRRCCGCGSEPKRPLSGVGIGRGHGPNDLNLFWHFHGTSVPWKCWRDLGYCAHVLAVTDLSRCADPCSAATDNGQWGLPGDPIV